jgi:hypothetical protein
MNAPAKLSATAGDAMPAMDVPPIFELQALVDAALLLANLQRVFDDVTFVADTDPAFEERLSTYSPAWRDPSTHDGGTMTELLRVASMRCRALGKDLDAHEKVLLAMRRPAGKPGGRP